MTLFEAFSHSLRTRRQWRDAKSPATLESTYRVVAGALGGHRRISEIPDAEVLAYLEGLRRIGKAPTTINTRIAFLRVLWAAAGVPFPHFERATVRPGRTRILTPAEEERVLEYFRGTHMAHLVPFLLDTGMRLGEAIKLRWRDVDMVERVVSVWENKASHPRRIPLSDRALDVLTLRKASPGDTVFAPLTVDSAEKRWKAMRKSLGLAGDRGFVIHALRHTCCSRMIARGRDAFRVQRFMGHKQITTTMRYVHLGVEDLRDLVL